MNFIDTHFHLDLYEDTQQIINEIEKNKIYTIAVTNTPSVFFYTYNLTENSKYIRPALGFHPELVYQRRNELRIFFENIKRARYIGEIGLDYGKQNDANKNEQRRIFEKIIDACSEYNDKILTIHSRGSYKDVIEIIGDNFPNKVIMHWYSGTLKELERAIDYGFYFSVNLPMTLSAKGTKTISSLPHDRILTESDGPFTQIGNKKCSPLVIHEIVDRISNIIKIDTNQCKKQIYDNFSSVLR